MFSKQRQQQQQQQHMASAENETRNRYFTGAAMLSGEFPSISKQRLQIVDGDASTPWQSWQSTLLALIYQRHW